jgi:hypothetical protein
MDNQSAPEKTNKTVAHVSAGYSGRFIFSSAPQASNIFRTTIQQE